MNTIDAHYSRYYSRMNAGITQIDPKTVRKSATVMKRTEHVTPIKAELIGIEHLTSLFKDTHESTRRNQSS